MNDDEFIADVWMLLKEFFDKKHIEMAAERYVDTLIDYGVDDERLKELLGTDKHLDTAIQYCLEIEEYDSYDDEVDEWDE